MYLQKEEPKEFAYSEYRKRLEEVVPQLLSGRLSSAFPSLWSLINSTNCTWSSGFLFLSLLSSFVVAALLNISSDQLQVQGCHGDGAQPLLESWHKHQVSTVAHRSTIFLFYLDDQHINPITFGRPTSHYPANTVSQTNANFLRSVFKRKRKSYIMPLLFFVLSVSGFLLAVVAVFMIKKPCQNLKTWHLVQFWWKLSGKCVLGHECATPEKFVFSACSLSMLWVIFQSPLSDHKMLRVIFKWSLSELRFLRECARILHLVLICMTAMSFENIWMQYSLMISWEGFILTLSIRSWDTKNKHNTATQ